MSKEYGFEKIKDLAKQQGVPAPSLLVLARKNDPFFAGSPGQRKLAEWFAGIWKQFDYATGIHTRRVHYQLASQPELCPRPDGKPYQNTLESWDYLARASKEARYLGLVRPDAFVDRRNPDALIFTEYEDVRDSPRCFFDEVYWYLPRISTDLSIDDIALPNVYATGYGYAKSDQPYHLEIWCEKSTMNDVLIPICQRYSVNLVTSIGFQSITAVINLLIRIEHSGKPARIFYISDFDPAGDSMPVGVARQIEFWIRQYCNQDIKLTLLALTRDQVIDYALPRIPIKESDKRRASFEDRYGEGAVELDALEALHPGVLAAIVREAITPYRDLNLQDRLSETETEAQEIVKGEWAEIRQEYEPELEAIKQDAEAILSDYRSKLEVLAAELETDLAPIADRLRLVHHEVQVAAARFVPDLPRRPDPEIDDLDEKDWLYDQERSYLEQLTVYKRRQGKEMDDAPKDTWSTFKTIFGKE